MKEEIKEILDNLFWYRHETVKYKPEDILTIEDIWLLYDYTTTLQEENEKLESILKLREDVIITQHNKIDKTIEYLKLFDRDSDMINHSIIRGALLVLQGDDKQ